MNDEQSISLSITFADVYFEMEERHMAEMSKRHSGDALVWAAFMATYIAHPPKNVRFAQRDILGALTLVVGIRKNLEFLEDDLLIKARKHRISFARIASALGLRSRQAAEQRMLRLQTGESDIHDAYLNRRREERFSSKQNKGGWEKEQWSRSWAAMARYRFWDRISQKMDNE
jgi:hypothetical protein